MENLLRDTKDDRCFFVDTKSFLNIPGSPFAYWVSERIRRLFKELSPFEDEGRTANVGLQTGDDFRFVRLWWEVPRENEARSRKGTLKGKRWIPFAKGGAYSPYYADIHLVVNWEGDGEELRSFERAYIRNEEYYFHPGLTWPSRTNELSIRIMPQCCIFGHKGPSAFESKNNYLLECLAVMNSFVFGSLLSLLIARVELAKSYEVGLIQKVPFPKSLPSELARLAFTCFSLKRTLDTANENSHVFVLPALLRNDGSTLKECLNEWLKEQETVKSQLREAQEAIDQLSFELYGIDEEDKKALLISDSPADSIHSEETEADSESPTRDEDSEDEAAPRSTAAPTQALLSWSIGVVLGRFDIRLATRELPVPELGEPFDPLPIYSPGMLQEIPVDYPVYIDADGILVDDETHSDDIVRRVRDVLTLLWKDRAGAIEQEACEILGVKSLREYIAKSGKGGFFDDHIKRYSKSRRKAPIYWLLQSSRKNYALWLYYHRLDKDMLFKALENYVRPKIQREENRLAELRQKKAALGDSGGKEAKNLDRDIDRADSFLSELIDFREKLERAATLYIEPDLNDGVVLNIAPLWELVPWSEAKKYWDELVKGSYEWSSIGKQLREKNMIREKH